MRERFRRWRSRIFLPAASILLSCTSPEGATPAPAADYPPPPPGPAGYESEVRIVRGASMAGVIEPGAPVRLVLGWYRDHGLERGDVVAYRYAGNPEPVVKRVRAVEGDSFQLREESGVWRIVVNGETLANAQGAPYGLGSREAKVLSLYERDYGGVVPAGACLLLGNQPGGSADSTRFGLVDKSEITAKILYHEIPAR